MCPSHPGQGGTRDSKTALGRKAPPPMPSVNTEPFLADCPNKLRAQPPSWQERRADIASRSHLRGTRSATTMPPAPGCPALPRCQRGATCRRFASSAASSEAARVPNDRSKRRARCSIGFGLTLRRRTKSPPRPPGAWTPPSSPQFLRVHASALEAARGGLNNPPQRHGLRERARPRAKAQDHFVPAIAGGLRGRPAQIAAARNASRRPTGSPSVARGLRETVARISHDIAPLTRCAAARGMRPGDAAALPAAWLDMCLRTSALSLGGTRGALPANSRCDNGEGVAEPGHRSGRR